MIAKNLFPRNAFIASANNPCSIKQKIASTGSLCSPEFLQSSKKQNCFAHVHEQEDFGWTNHNLLSVWISSHGSSLSAQIKQYDLRWDPKLPRSLLLRQPVCCSIAVSSTRKTDGRYRDGVTNRMTSLPSSRAASSNLTHTDEMALRFPCLLLPIKLYPAGRRSSPQVCSACKSHGTERLNY